jgi:hypothetical protein
MIQTIFFQRKSQLKKPPVFKNFNKNVSSEKMSDNIIIHVKQLELDFTKTRKLHLDYF